MADASVNVELKLLTQKALQTAKEFANSLGGAIGGGKGGGKGGAADGSPMDKAGKDVDAFAGKVDKLNKKLGDTKAAALAAWRAANPGGVAPGQKITIAPDVLPKGVVPQGSISVGPVTGGGLATVPTAGLGAGGQSPKQAVPPVIPGAKGTPTTMAGMLANLMNASLTKGQAALVAFNAGLAGIRVAVGLTSYAFRAVTGPARQLAQVFQRMTENARQSYAHALQSGGMPLGFSIYRSNLAKIIGVGENEVFQYGKAVQYLTDRMKVSSQAFAQSTPALTSVAWHSRILSNDFAALGSLIAARTVPAIRGLYVVMEKLTEYAIKAEPVISKMLKGFMQGVVNAAFGPLAGLVAKIAPGLLAKITGGGNVPPPDVSARRLQTSPWERMGLVLGPGGADNPAQKTAQNTTKMVGQLARMIDITRMTHPELYKKQTGAMAP